LLLGKIIHAGTEIVKAAYLIDKLFYHYFFTGK
jgi:hypothetical protein